MGAVDPRLVSALRQQLARRPAGARRVGWKVGRGDRERIGDGIVIGHLTSATLLTDGETFRGGGVGLHADAEVTLELGEECTIVGYGVALEVVDLAAVGDAEAIVVGNVFHRAVVFGPLTMNPPQGGDGALVVNGERRDAAPVAEDFAATVAAVSELLASVNERLEPGDRLITGSIVQVPIASGDIVDAEIAGLGNVAVAIA